MPFSEATQLDAKQRSHYACVWCQRTDQFIEVHHIVPQEENGSDTIDNAAPLGPNCHSLIGSSFEIRRQLRERRGWWWQHCSNLGNSLPYKDMSRKLSELVDSLRNVEAQGGRNEGLLTQLKSHIVDQLQAQVTAVSSAGTASEVITAIQPHEPSVYQLTATVTYTGTGRRDGMPHPYKQLFRSFQHGHCVRIDRPGAKRRPCHDHPGCRRLRR